MNDRMKINKLLVLSALTLLFILAVHSISFADVTFQVSTGTFEAQGITDKDGNYLWGDGPTLVGCLVQIIIITPEGSGPELPNADGSPRLPHNVLYASTYIGDGYPFEPPDNAHGRFDTSFNVTVPSGTKILVRVWNSTEATSSTYYGNSYIFTAVNNDTWTISTGDAYPAFSTNITFDAFPPGPPSNLKATQEVSGDIIITWTPTTDADTVGTRLIWRTDRPPTREWDYTGSNSTEVLIAAAQAYRHQNLTEGTTYEYAAFCYDAASNFSTGVTTRERSHDSLPPSVVSVVPANGATAVPATSTITVNFDDTMGKTSAQNAFSAFPAISGSFSWQSTDHTMVFTPGSSLGAGITYHCTVDTSAQDSAGNTLSSTKEWSFTAAVGQVPYITDMKIGGYKTQPGEAISPQVRITATIIDPDFLPPLSGISTVEIAANSLVYHYSTPELYSIFTKNTGHLDFRFPAPLDSGTYTITLKAWDVEGNITEESVPGLRVNVGNVEIDGKVLNYPYKFESGKGTTFAYKLTADGNVQIRIYSIKGLVYHKDYSSGAAGGTAGYNEVFWDGLAGSGSTLGNGMYIVKIYDNSDKVLGTSRLIIENKE